jgi:hypothetical protein
MAAYPILAGILFCLLYFISFAWLWLSIVDEVEQVEPIGDRFPRRLAWWWPPFSQLLIRVHRRHYPSSRKVLYFRLVRGLGILLILSVLLYAISRDWL